MLFQETVSGNPSERPEPEPEKDALLQLILGTDKRNPCFSIYEDEERHQWHVYYGFELLQVVPQEREGLAFKIMVGQLYNANVKVAALQEVFAVDPKTMKRWGDVIIKGDPEELLRVMAGRQQGRKLTPEIRALIRLRWLQLRAQGERKYRQKIQVEVEAVFGVRLCGETPKHSAATLVQAGCPFWNVLHAGMMAVPLHCEALHCWAAALVEQVTDWYSQFPV